VNIIGYMIDIGRGQRGDVAYLKDSISRLAGHGYNMVMLYLEYRLRFRRHPLLAAPDSLGPDDARELGAFARAQVRESTQAIESAHTLTGCEKTHRLEFR